MNEEKFKKKTSIFKTTDTRIKSKESKPPDYFWDKNSSEDICGVQMSQNGGWEDVGQEYSYESTLEEASDVTQIEEEEVEYSYERVMEEEEIEYSYESVMEKDTDVAQIEGEKRNCVYEDIISESEAAKKAFNYEDGEGMGTNWIYPKKMISDDEVNHYLLAKEIIRKHELKRLSKTETAIWRFTGKSYEPLNDQRLGELIYSEIPEGIKLQVRSCKGIKQNVIEFIRDELAQAVGKGNKKFYFSSEDYEDIMGKVVLQNGVYDIRRGRLEKHDATKPYYYELKASYLTVSDECLQTPAFDKLISDACGGDEDSVRMIIQGIGMLLMPDKNKKFPVLGPASNSGKSVLCGRFLEEILPRSRISHVPTSALAGKFALGNAEELLLISCMDVDIGAISSAAAGVIKRATGEEIIMTEKKYGGQKETEVRFKFVFGTNGSFCSQGYDAGWQNRILVLPFIHETPEEEMDPYLFDKLMEEKDAIVTKMLRTLRSAVTEKGELLVKESELSLKLKYSWTMVGTYFDEFMSEMVEITGVEEENYSTAELYEAYVMYYICMVSQNSEQRNNKKLSDSEFVSNVLKYGRGLIEKKRTKNSFGKRFKNAHYRICGLLLKKP